MEQNLGRGFTKRKRSKAKPCKVGSLKTIPESKATSMCHMHTFGSNKYMRVILSVGGFKFDDGFLGIPTLHSLCGM